MFQFFGKKKADRYLIMISIETGRVVLNVIELKLSQSANVPYMAHYLMPFDETPTATELSRKVLGTLETAIKDLEKSSSAQFIPGAEVIVLLGSPWHVSWSDKVEINKDKPFKIVRKLIDESVSGAFKAAHDGFDIISRHIMGYKMNGYAMGEPVGRVTSSLEMHAYVESAPQVVLSSLRNLISKHLPHLRIRFTTASFAAVEAVKQYSNLKDFMLILPEYDVTDVILVRGGMIQTSASLPSGAATMARDLFGKDSSGIEEAFTKSNRLLRGELDSKEFTKATNLAEAIKTKLVADLRNILWKMNEFLMLPSDCIVVGDNVASHFIAKWLDEEDDSEETFTLNGFKVQLLSGKDLAPLLAIDISNHTKVPFSTVSGTIIGRQINQQI